LLNASVGVQRALARLRTGPGRRSSTAINFQRHRASIARTIRAGRSVGRPTLSGERLVSLTAVGLVALALAVSNLTTDAASGPTGNTEGSGSEARIAAGGAVSGNQDTGQGIIDDRNVGDGTADSTIDSPVDMALGETSTDGPGGPGVTPDDSTSIDGPFRDDGTLMKPFAVDTTVADGKALLRTYRVKSGDTLTGIAQHFSVSMMTVWWANDLKAKNDLHIGQLLVIPPVNGVVVTVTAADTLESLAAKFEVEPAEIIDANNLADPNLVVGQTLTIPGARSAGIATPKPTPRPAAKSGSTHTTTRAPARYSGGRFAWPVPGGYISQYFHYGHYAIDIAADPGTRVVAAAGGTVIFAGWKNNGGGYQVWISHGSNLYTTYNHMMSVSVGRGQGVSRGQQVGRVGMTGNATGPHCHFEVWRGPVWAGGVRVNPLLYL
jgi:murein DD-endopeptidase MepM/ murein hydrolase activator NlpD